MQRNARGRASFGAINQVNTGVISAAAIEASEDILLTRAVIAQMVNWISAMGQ